MLNISKTYALSDESGTKLGACLYCWLTDFATNNKEDRPMAWILKLEEVQDGKVVRSAKIMTLDRPARVDRLDDLGLRLAEGKALLAETQKRIVTRQFASERQARSTCPGCGEVQ